MIYYLSFSLRGYTGGSRAGADVLRSMVSPRWGITVVCKNRIDVPREVQGESVSELHWLVPPWTLGDNPRLADRARAPFERLLNRKREARIRTLLEEELQAQPPGLAVHNGFPEKGSVATKILECVPKKLIVVHSTPEAVDYFRRAGSTLTREWISEHLRAADTLMFVSSQLKDEWTEVAGLTSKRTFVIPNTCREAEAEKVNLLSRRRLRQLLGFPEQALIICCVGRIEPGKGQDVLLSAVPELIKEIPTLRVVFVGWLSPLCEHLPDQARAMGLRDRVLFAGVRDNPYSYIRASDMLVHPSRTEGQGMVLLEAMILGTPVIATRVGGIPSTVEHGVSGWLIPPDDVQALVDTVQALAQNPALRAQLAQAAVARYWQHFSNHRHRAHIQRMIASCLGLDALSSPDWDGDPQDQPHACSAPPISSHQL